MTTENIKLTNNVIDTNGIDTNEALSNIINSFNTINDSLTLFKMQISTIQQQLRGLEKDIKKEIKSKKNNKIKLTIEPKKPSGFAKPSKVTKELCEFLQQPEGTELARTEVTKSLIQYIKSNKLDNRDVKGTTIVPDDKLKTLLNIDDSELADLTFFNIQKYMNKHFISKKKYTNDEVVNNKI